jgi:hypothetical protein
MPQLPSRLEKAELREIRWDDRQQAIEINRDKTVKVQFNPETLKVNFSNQKAGGDQRGGSASQFVGAGATKLSLELWFDVTVPLSDGSLQEEGDVRRITQKVNYFITPKKVRGETDKWIPPGVRFVWGTFLFDGTIDSMDENLEFFSDEGKPLRAKVSLSLSRQEIQFQFNEQQSPGRGGTASPGLQPQKQARKGDTVQKMAAREGKAKEWKPIASDNDIENPRRLKPGTMIRIMVRI